MLTLPDPELSWWLLSFIFITAGLVKGVVGTGLPVVAIAFLSTHLSLTAAISIILAPAIVTNIAQAAYGGQLVAIISRFKWLYIMAVGCIAFGLFIQSYIPEFALFILLGGLLILYAVAGWFKFQAHFSYNQQRVLTPLVGALNGTIAGLVGILYFPSILFFQALNLDRNCFVQAIGLLFLLSGLTLGLGYAFRGDLDLSNGLVSLLCVIPALLGLGLGTVIRAYLSEAMFKQALLFVLFVSGVYICLRGLALGGAIDQFMT